jgi:hypothetical protein
MFNPKCDKKYVFIKDDALNSTKNFLKAHEIINENTTILNTIDFNDAVKWLTDKAVSKNKNVNTLISEKDGKAVFNSEEFNKLNNNSISKDISKKQEVSISEFSKEIGLGKKYYSSLNRNMIQEKIGKYNIKNNTNFYIEWKQLGQSDNWSVKEIKGGVKKGEQQTLFQKDSPNGIISSEKTLKDLAERISDRIGIKYKFISDRSQEFKGKIENNVAIINLAYATLDTPIHEILAHPIIRALKNNLKEKDFYLKDGTKSKSGTYDKDGNLVLRTIDKIGEKSDNNYEPNVLYQNLLKELEEGRGKEVLDRIKKDYQFKNDFNLVPYIENGIIKGYNVSSTAKQRSTFFKNREEAESELEATNIPYTLEEQQEEAIVQLLGEYTAEKLDRVKDGKLISLLKRVLAEVKSFVRDLLKQKEINVESLPENLTLGELSDLLAYSNSKIILPGYKVEYTTPDNNKFSTYSQALKHVGELAKNAIEPDLSNTTAQESIDKGQPIYNKYGVMLDDFISKAISNGLDNEHILNDIRKLFLQADGEWLHFNYSYGENWQPEFYGDDSGYNAVTNFDSFQEFIEKNHIDFHKEFGENTLDDFKNKNKEYEQSKEIIEEWKKINGIKYNPEEIYSRGQGFYSVVGAYSDFDVNLMFQNILHHIEDNQKAGGEFTISAFTKPIDRKIGHLEDGSKIKFVIYPKSEDIKWATNTDAYSGSVWDAAAKINKSKQSELLGVSYTKYPSLNNINSVQPNLVDIVDNLSHHHNELGIALNNNFRLEYDDTVPYTTKKLIDNINKILDQKFGKLEKPEINTQDKEKVTKFKVKGEPNIFNTREEAQTLANRLSQLDYQHSYIVTSIQVDAQKGISPTITKNDLKLSLSEIKSNISDEGRISTLEHIIKESTLALKNNNFKVYSKEQNEKMLKDAKVELEILKNIESKEKNSQTLINKKISALKEVSKKYPASLIRSEVKKENNNSDLFNNDELPFQKIPSQANDNEVQYKLKAIELLSTSKAQEIWNKGKKAGWDLNKTLTELQIPKEQKEIIVDWAKNNKPESINDIITGVLADLSYGVEINTAKEKEYNTAAKLRLNSPNFDLNGSEYRVEIVGGEENHRGFENPSFDIYFKDGKEISDKEYEKALNKKTQEENINTQYYSNLTATGHTKSNGWEYEEREIAVPGIIPSIKGHAQFSTDNGIGWSRVTINKEKGILAVNENQSDLFQKGRDKKDLVQDNEMSFNITDSNKEEFEISKRLGVEEEDEDGQFSYTYKGVNYFQDIFTDNYLKYSLPNPNTSKNQFLQLLNKEGNWVSFFIKAQIQDAAKQGMKEIWFPTGDTASKIEGHSTLEEFKKEKEGRILELEKRKENTLREREEFSTKKEKVLSFKPENYDPSYHQNYFATSLEEAKKKDWWVEDYYKVEDVTESFNKTRNEKAISGTFEKSIEGIDNEIQQLKNEIQRVETEGFGALKPIWTFYETRVGNTLRKIYGDKIERITDEYDNQWWKLSIDDTIKNHILLSKDGEKQTQEKYNIIKNKLFKDKTIVNSTDVLNRIINSSNTPYIQKLGSIIARYEHNPVPISLLSQEEAEQYILDNKLKVYKEADVKNIAGFYDPKNNVIIIVDKPSKNLEGLILHEILHANTRDFLHSNEKLAKEFGNLYRITKESMSESEQKEYGFTNVDEFLTAILTDESFQKLLASKPSPYKAYTNKWEEIKSFLMNALTQMFGLNFKEYTLLDHLLNKSLDVVEEAYNSSQDVLESNIDKNNYVLTALDSQDREDVKEDVLKYNTLLKNTIEEASVQPMLEKILKYFKRNEFDLKTAPFKEQRELYQDDITNSNAYFEISRRLDSAIKSGDIDLKILALSDGIATIKKLTELSFNRIKEITSDSKNAKENISLLANYMELMNSYEASLETVRAMNEGFPHEIYNDVIHTLGKIEDARRYVLRNDTTGMVSFLQKYMNSAATHMQDWHRKEIKSEELILARAEKKNDVALIRNTKQRIENHEKSIKDYDFTNDKNILGFLKGLKGDLSRNSKFFNSFRDIADPILGGFVSYVESMKEKVTKYGNDIQISMDRELAPHYKAVGFDPIAFTKRLSDLITFADTQMDRDGNMKKVLTYLNPYKNYMYDRDLFLHTIRDLKIKKEQGENVDAELKAKILEYAKWQAKHMVRSKTDEYYETYDKLYNDEIGSELRERRSVIYNQLEYIDSKISEGTATEQEKADKAMYSEQLIELKRLTNKNGEYKTGIELQIAQRAQEIAKVDNQHYDYVTNTRAFERDKLNNMNLLIAKYGIDSQEYIDGTAKWEKENTRQVISQDFYALRNALSARLNELISEIPNSDFSKTNIGEKYQKIFDLTYGYRDVDGQPVGTDISEESAAKIKELQEEIEKIKETFNSFSGLNEKDSLRWKELYDKRHKGLSTAENEEFKELDGKSKASSLSKAKMKEIKSIFIQLREMQSRQPTPYYIQAFNDASNIKIDDDGRLNGVDILNSPQLNELLENKEFKEWWDKNHFKSLVYDEAIGHKVEKWNRLYQWSKVQPTDPKFIETLPSKDYTIRLLKDEYKTKQIVGITTDNRGNFLPKLSSDKYVNKDYFRLQNSTDPKDKALFNILEIQKKYHLYNQELAVQKKKKLWNEIPRERKDSYERNVNAVRKPQDFSANTWDRVKSWFKGLQEYSSETGNFKITDDTISDESPDVFSLKKGAADIAVPYLDEMDINDVSTDLRKSLLQYGMALKTNEVLKEALPYAKSLREIFEKNVPKTNDKKLFGISSGKNNRLDALDVYVAREFYGQSKVYEMGPTADKVVGVIKGLGALKFLKFNISSDIVNFTDAMTQNFINAGNNHYTQRQYHQSAALHTRIMGNTFNDFFNELGKYSADTLLFRAFEGVQEKTLHETLAQGKSKLKYGMSLDVLMGLRSKTEYYAQSRIYSAYMYATKVDSKEGLISLADAYELNSKGNIQLKAGVDKEWELFTGEKFLDLKRNIQKSVRDSQGAYAKADRTLLEQYTYINFALFLKKFFIQKFLNHFAYDSANSSFSIKDGFTIAPRYNPITGTYLGYWASALNTFSKMYRNKSFDYSYLTEEEKMNTLKFFKELGVMAILYTVTSLLIGGGSDKDKNRAINQMSDGEAYLLYQLLRLQNETETIVSPTQYKDFIMAPSAASVITSYLNVFSDLASQEEFKKTTALHKKGDLKWQQDLLELTGVWSFYGKFADPQTAAINYRRAINSKAK